MEKKELLYEGRSKMVYATDDTDYIIMHYKDDATAFNGVKKATIGNKGIINNKISAILYNRLNEAGIPTHFVKEINDREQICKKVTVMKIEMVVRNIIAGSMSKRLNIPEGTKPKTTVYELGYMNESLGDPMINDSHAVALGLVTSEELKTIYNLTERINKELQRTFLECGIVLVDFKLEFGKDKDGNIILADEFSPDTCRLWDVNTNDKLDKDRFRRDLGNVLESYRTIYNRLNELK